MQKQKVNIKMTMMLSQMGYVHKFVLVNNFKRLPNYTNGYISWKDYRGNIVTLADVMDIVDNMSFKELQELAEK